MEESRSDRGGEEYRERNTWKGNGTEGKRVERRTGRADEERNKSRRKEEAMTERETGSASSGKEME